MQVNKKANKDKKTELKRCVENMLHPWTENGQELRQANRIRGGQGRMMIDNDVGVGAVRVRCRIKR